MFLIATLLQSIESDRILRESLNFILQNLWNVNVIHSRSPRIHQSMLNEVFPINHSYMIKQRKLPLLLTPAEYYRVRLSLTLCVTWVCLYEYDIACVQTLKLKNPKISSFYFPVTILPQTNFLRVSPLYSHQHHHHFVCLFYSVILVVVFVLSIFIHYTTTQSYKTDTYAHTFWIIMW